MRVKRWAPILVLTPLLALGACGGSNSETDDPRPRSAAAGQQSASADQPAPHYAMFPGDAPGAGWELTDAVRTRGADDDGRNGGAQLGGLPGVDWYAEFNGPPVDEDSTAFLSLTGYTQSLAERRSESVSDTSDVTEGEISGHPAFWTIDPDDPDSGSVVTWEVEPGYTLELFATGVAMDELVAMAKTVRDVSESEWVATEAKATGCSPTAEDCPDSAEG